MSFLQIINGITNKAIYYWDNFFYGGFGRNSKVIQPLRIKGKRRIFIGDEVTILNNVRMETIRTWGEHLLNGRLHIGNNTTFEQCCHIIAANEVKIGDNCVFSAFVYISDCSHGYNPDESIMNSDLQIKKVSIGNHCFVGIGSCIMPGVTLGDNVVIGANSVVVNNIPSNFMAVGSPAKVIKKYSFELCDWINVESL